MKKARKSYSEEFKRDAASLVMTGGYTLKAVSEKLGRFPKRVEELEKSLRKKGERVRR